MRVLGFTGSRADYFLQRPFFRQLSLSSKVDFSLIVSGGILEEESHNTLNQISEDGFNIETYIRLEDCNDPSHLVSISQLLADLPQVVKNFSPDLCVVYADRYESFAFAQVCFHLDHVLLHIEAGDLTYGGTFDDSIRHAITNLSHLYSVTTKASYDVLTSFGIASSRIHHTGLLSYDNLSTIEICPGEDILDDLDLNPSKPLILATYHPIPRDPSLTASEASSFFQALGHISHTANIIITSPNHDGGRSAILSSIEPLTRMPSVRYVESLGGRRYYSLMSYSKNVPVVVAGNSSSVIKEAPFFNAHSLNVGVRQTGRTSAPSQINVEADPTSITKVLNTLCNTPCQQVDNPYFKPEPSRELYKFVIDVMDHNSHNQLLSNHIFSTRTNL